MNTICTVCKEFETIALLDVCQSCLNRRYEQEKQNKNMNAPKRCGVYGCGTIIFKEYETCSNHNEDLNDVLESNEVPKLIEHSLSIMVREMNFNSSIYHISNDTFDVIVIDNNTGKRYRVNCQTIGQAKAQEAKILRSLI